MIIFESLLKQAIFFEAVGTLSKISLGLKPNHHDKIKLFRISDTLCGSPESSTTPR
jgi:hypothetical protein